MSKHGKKDRSLRAGFTTGVSVLMGAGALAGLVTVTLWSMPEASTSTSSTEALRSAPVAAMSADPLMTLVAWTGVGPDALAAAGVTVEEAETLYAVAAGLGVTQAGAVGVVQANLTAARRTKLALDRLAQGGGASEEDLLDLAAARTALVQAEQSRRLLTQQIFSAVTAGLTEGQRATLETLALNISREVPFPYRTIERTDAEWLALRNALNSVRVAGEMGEEPNGEAVALIEEADEHPTVTAALAAYAANVAGIRAAWESRAGE